MANRLIAIESKVDDLRTMTTCMLTEMELGDLVIEIDFVEIAPVKQECVCSDHDHVGSTFHLVQGCVYKLVINVFREGGSKKGTTTNPVSVAHSVTLAAQDNGAPKNTLALQPSPVEPKKAQLPQCITYAAIWDPVLQQSATLLTPTKWPNTHKVTVDIALELKHLPNQQHVVSTELFFQVHKKQTVGMKVKRAKSWAKEEYLQLKPSTRALISGAVTVVKLAGQVALV